ncbi:MAG TPA: copper chaperone PCu(A)C, partial [bacterium]
TLIGCFALAATATAHDFKLGDLTIEHPWARPTDKMAKTGAVYFTIKNAGIAADRLVGVASDKAATVGLHQTVNKDGMLSMQHADALDIPAGGSAALKPGGYHIMFMNLKAPFTEGDKFPLTLTFAKAGKVTVDVWVEKPKDDGKGAPMPMEPDHGMMKH